MITTLIPLPVAMPLLMAAFIALMRYLGVSANRLAALVSGPLGFTRERYPSCIFFPMVWVLYLLFSQASMYKSWLLEPPPGLKTNIV